jgi:peptidoglycan/LPS O-acetylase OafA/YrhL
VRTATEKDVPLEALRGLAAIGVVLWHSIQTFYPQYFNGPLRGQFWFVLADGPGAVNLFFVLSAFVLTRKYLLTGNDQLILRGAIKRLPRLAGPVLVSTFFSWLLFAANGYTFSYLMPKVLNPIAVEDTSLREALSVGLRTFFDGSYSFNVVLWTMRPELIGSYIAFGLALILFRLRHSTIAAAALLGIVAFLCQQSQPSFMAFPFGVALALFLPRRTENSIPFPLAIVAMMIGLYLLGYSGDNIGVYRIFGTSLHAPLSGKTSLFGTFHFVEITVLGATILVAIAQLSPQIRRGLSIKFMAWIGELSFPLYLVHIPIISSVGTASLVWLSSTGMATEAAFAFSFVCSFAAAIPLLAFNRRWIVVANHLTELCLSFNGSATSRYQESVRRLESGVQGGESSRV